MKIQSIPSPTTPSEQSLPPRIETTVRTSNKATPGSPKERAMAMLMGQAAELSNLEKPAKSIQNDISESVSAPEETSTEQVEAAPEAVEATTATPEAQAPQEEQQKVTPQPMSQQYAILARKEKALRQREQQLKAREAALNPPAPVEAPKAPSNAYDPTKFVSKDELAKNPFGVLNQLGLTYDKLVDIVTNGPSHEQISTQSELQALREELRALKSETESTKKTFETSQEELNKQAVGMMKKEANKLIDTDESFELVKLENRDYILGEITNLITKVYEDDGEFLSVTEAASLIEDQLAERATRYASAKKIQSRLKPAAPAAAAPVKTNGQAQKTGELKTLTNSVGTTRPLTSRERAILAMQGKLTS